MLLEIFMRFSAADDAATALVGGGPTSDAVSELVHTFTRDLQRLAADVGPLEHWAVAEVVPLRQAGREG